MRILTLTIHAAAWLLASCSTPPKPPTVDDSVRRPVNSAQAIELQRCVSERSAVSIALAEAQHAATRAAATADARAAQAAQHEREACRANVRALQGTANRLFVIPFATGSATVQLAPDDLERITQAAQASPLVIVRGRTDGPDSPAETALARRRAQATADVLIRAGLPKDRLRLQWQGGANPDADTPQGVGDRRAEVELYGTRPERVALANQAQ